MHYDINNTFKAIRKNLLREHKLQVTLHSKITEHFNKHMLQL